MTAPFAPGDVVVCVDHDLCLRHGPVPHERPEMIGGVFKISMAQRSLAGCLGYVRLAGFGEYYCIGTLRKIEAPNTEIAQAIRACRPTPAKVDAA